MSTLTLPRTAGRRRDFIKSTKPRVVVMLVFTAVIGMLLATSGVPDPVLIVLGIGLALGAAGLGLLYLWVNPLTAALTAVTFFGYAAWSTPAGLKPATPQNIVIGGVSGAMPPTLGWP